MEEMGVRSALIKWFASYLDERSQAYTRVQDRLKLPKIAQDRLRSPKIDKYYIQRNKHFGTLQGSELGEGIVGEWHQLSLKVVYRARFLCI